MPTELPTIRVMGFRTDYAKNIETGRRDKAVDFVCYAPVHSIMSTRIWERVNDLRPPESLDGDDEGKKMAFLRHRWAMIEPAYEAWKKGAELPVNGTPLGAWPGINQDQAQVFIRAGLRTVEDVASMPDSVLTKVHLPNVREFRQQAKAFLEATDRNVVADKLAQQDKQIQDLNERLAAAMELLDEANKPKRGPGRPRKEESEAA